MNIDELSPEMRRALEAAKQNGGKLKRLPGGYWIGSPNGVSYGTTTVRALIARKKAIYSDWRRGGGGEFPVEITLAPTE